MKKILYFFVTLLFAVVLIPNVFAKDNVKIESYELVENSKTTTELSPPKINGLNISFDLSFSNLNDYAKYKITINNSTNKEYEISKDIDFDISDYITYEYEFEKNNNVVPANSKMTMYIVITYSKEVPSDMMKDGKFIENNKMAISLSNDTSSTSKEDNPNTSSSILIICVLGLSIALASLILFAKTKKQRYITTFVLSLFMLPTTIFAIEKLQINVETKITIEEKYKVSYERYGAIKASEKDKCILKETIRKLKIKPIENPTYIIGNEEYVQCYYVTEEYYSKGETVNVKEMPFNYIIDEEYNDDIDEYVNICEFDEDNNKKICPEKSLIDDTYTNAGYYHYNNPTAKENDDEVMNISNIIINKWQEKGHIEFYTPSKFTMPDHDVYINYYKENELEG